MSETMKLAVPTMGAAGLEAQRAGHLVTVTALRS